MSALLEGIHKRRLWGWLAVVALTEYVLIRARATPLELIIMAVGGVLLAIGLTWVATGSYVRTGVLPWLPVVAAGGLLATVFRLQATAWELKTVVIGGLAFMLVVAWIAKTAYATAATDKMFAPTVVGGAALLGGAGVLYTTLVSVGMIGTGVAPIPDRLRTGRYVDPLAPADTVHVLDRATLDTSAAYRRAVLSWIDSNVTFDSLKHGQSDRNYMDTYGTRGLIVAADGMNNTHPNTLKEGRVVWYVRLTGEYTNANLPEGRSYVYAYGFSKVARTDSASVEQYARYGVVHQHVSHDTGKESLDTAGEGEARDRVVNALVSRYRHRGKPPVDTATLRRARVDATVLMEAESDTLIGFAYALVIPRDSIQLPVRRIKIALKEHSFYYWTRPNARWAGPGTYHPWSLCDHNVCCEGFHCGQAC